MFSLINSCLGWYVGTVKEYDKEKDEVEVEFDTERGHTYKYCVTQEFKGNRLKLTQSTKRKIQCYEEIVEIGARVEMRWTEEDLSETEWPAGKRNWRFT